MADNDKHESPANPDNRVELERLAADAENKEQILEHPLGEEKGKNLHPPKSKAAAARAARTKTRRRVGKKVVEVQSTGHSWDGIEEYDNPLPRWWLWTFYATIVWAVLYTIAYPAWPLISGATEGVLGFSTRQEVAREIERYNAANAGIQEQLATVDLASISDDPELVSYASHAGQAVFQTWCVGCHQSGGAGAPGYPTLVDDAWLWGGTLEDIHFTVTHGVRNADDPEARYSEMPRFGVDGILEDEAIDQVTEYVLSISGQKHNAAKAEAGSVVFADNCSACHGEDGKGDIWQGAPNLTDAIWLYGGDRQTIRYSVYNARFGVMPNWNERLSEDEIRAVSYYVHSLGGGE